MNLRALLLALTFVVAGLGTASAQIKILSASYGRPAPQRSLDVRDRLQKLTDSGTLAFHVNPGFFGLNPNPGRANYLVVEYIAFGQKNYGRAEDGDRFAFKGAPPVSSGGRDRVRFENGFGRTIFLYELNSRWGSWDWKAQLDPGSVYSAIARPGDRWIATDRSGRTLKQISVPRELGLLRLR